MHQFNVNSKLCDTNKAKNKLHRMVLVWPQFQIYLYLIHRVFHLPAIHSILPRGEDSCWGQKPQVGRAEQNTDFCSHVSHLLFDPSASQAKEGIPKTDNLWGLSITAHYTHQFKSLLWDGLFFRISWFSLLQCTNHPARRELVINTKRQKPVTKATHRKKNAFPVRNN